MKVAAVYIRVSSDEQARHGFSLGEQRADLIEYARKKGYTVYDVYADEGCTARAKLNRRHELQRLLGDVRAKRIDIILLKCLDRWFRNVADFYKVQEILDANNVAWECSQEDYNTTTTNGRLMLNLKLAIAQNESDQTSDRIKYVNEGRRKRREEIAGRCTLGYSIVDKRLVIDEKTRPIVEFIFNQVLSGYSTHSISKAIYEQFDYVLNSNRVWLILRNESYKGTRYGIENYCPVIIPPEIFDRVQDILSRNKRPAHTGNVILFSGKMSCPSCGHAMVAKRGRRLASGIKPTIYVCGYRNIHVHIPGEGCQFGGSVAESSIENFLVANIFPLLESHVAEIREQASSTEDLEAKRKAIEAKLGRLKELYVEGLIDKPTFLTDRQKFQSQLADLVPRVIKRKKPPALMKKILSDTDFAATYNAMPKIKKRELWQSLIKSITICPRPTGTGRFKDFIVEFY